jgi:hypothetical protein
MAWEWRIREALSSEGFGLGLFSYGSWVNDCSFRYLMDDLCNKAKFSYEFLAIICSTSTQMCIRSCGGVKNKPHVLSRIDRRVKVTGSRDQQTIQTQRNFQRNLTTPPAMNEHCLTTS